MSTDGRTNLALSCVGLFLGLASFFSPVPFVLSAPGFVLSVWVLWRLRRGAR